MATRSSEFRSAPTGAPGGGGRNESVDALLTEELRSFLRARGADLIGFGPVSRLAGAPEIMQPRRYLPNARTMVSIGLRVNEASCDLIARAVQQGETPPSYHSYQLFTLAAVNPQLDELAYQGAKLLERRGYRAYPFPANIPHLLKPSEEYPGGPGDISHKHVAVACGLGDIGWHSLLMTPEFGTRQKLTSIATDALLEADPLSDARPCDPRACGVRCADSCPTRAIPHDLDDKVSLGVGGRTVEYGKLVGWRCRWGCSGMLECAGGYKNIPLPREEPTAAQLLEYKAKVDPWQERLRRFGGLLPYCGRCYCACPTPSSDRAISSDASD